MSWIVVLTQLVLPLLLLIWLAFFPAAGRLAWGIQLVSVALALAGVGLAALWTMPPFWVPYLYGLALAMIAIVHSLRRRRVARGPGRESPANTIAVVVVFGLGLAGGFVAYQALKGRVVPEEKVANIAAPFPSGYYLVAHGGSTEMTNAHLKTLDEAVERFRPWRGQSKGLDIFRIMPLGVHKEGWQPMDPAKYFTFETPVLAPCQGQVALVVEGYRDMTVPEMDRSYLPGNFVAVDCGEFVVILAHLRRGSINVAAGDPVEVGDSLGQMGNSGNSSEPHLHVHAQEGLPADAPLSGEPMWLTINGRFLVRNDRILLIPAT